MKAAVLLPLLLVGCTQQSAEEKFLNTVTHQVIVPAYQQLAESSRSLVTDVNEYCQSPADVSAVKQQWLQTMGDWQAVQGISFGPIRENNLVWELQFWPDKKNLVARKNRELLKSDDELNEARIQRASVVVRGLSSLEFLLFDPKAESYAELERRCQLMSGVSQHIASVAEHLHQQWRDHYSQVLLHPGQDNPEYPETKQALAVVVDSYLSSLEVVRDRKLAQALGLKARKQRLNPFLLESWRSQSSLQHIQRNVDAVSRLMNEGGFRAYLQSQQQQLIAEQIDAHLGTLQGTLQNTEGSFFQQLNQQNPETMNTAYQQVTPLIDVFKQQLPKALGIQLGFNNNDGD